MEVILILVVAAILFLAPAFLIRALARIPFYWIFNPANTFALIVTEEDKSGDGMSGGGNIVNILHAVPGVVLKKDSPDIMKWEFEPGEEPEHGFLYRTLGVQSMGNIFYTPRVNLERRPRFAREDKVSEKDHEVRATTTEELHTVTKITKSKHVFYTGEVTVKVKEADTSDSLGIDFEIDLIFERQFPARSVLRLANSAAFLESLVKKIINNTTVSKPAQDYIGGKKVQENREELANVIKTNKIFHKEILKQIGLKITSVSIRDVSMPADQRAILQRKIGAEKNREVTIINADAAMQAKILDNTAAADRITRVILPAAQDERTVAVRQAEAYENNENVTVYAPGTNTMIPVGAGK